VLKKTNEQAVYNMLQDLRHLIILDFREKEEYDKKHIRKAIMATLSDYK